MPITHVIAFDDASGNGSVISTNRIYAVHGSNLSYPQTVGGITHGFTSDQSFGQVVLASVGWNTGESPILKGRLRVQNAGLADLRADTGNGALDFMALATIDQNQRIRVRVYDGPATGTLLTEINTIWTADSPPGWPTEGYVDFATQGTNPTVVRAISASDPVSVAFTRAITVTQGYITVRFGEYSGGAVRTEISAIGWGAAGGGGVTRAAFRRRSMV